MTDKHTPEPWDPPESLPDGTVTVAMPIRDYRRAVACVNACTGIETERLEASCGVGALLMPPPRKK